jgi:WS/DGAT/MGAT family acyltransferase
LAESNLPAARRPRIQFNDRMSAADALMWSIESDPALRSTIVSMWVLDQAPDWARFESKLGQSVADIPRLRQRVVSDPLGLAPPVWEDDPNFDISFHIRRHRAPGDGSLRALLDAAAPIGMHAFDRDRPLWELHVFEGLEGGRAGIVMKLHHAISDGVGLVRMTEGMIERSREVDLGEGAGVPREVASVAEPPTDLERTRRAGAARFAQAAENLRRIRRALRGGLADLARNPVDTVRSARDGVKSLGRLLAPVTEPLSTVMQGRSLSVHYDTIFLSLDELKRAGKVVGCTVNDAFVAGVTGGLRRYHESLGAPVEELRMNMPINMREGDKGKDAGNQFMPVRFPVPVGIEDPAERMLEIRRRVAEQRSEPALPLMNEISAVIGALPGDGAARFSGLMMKAIDLTTSNVPGPRFPVYMSGARVEHTFGFGPLAGAALNVTCFSYNGELGIGLNADPAAVTDPALLVECLRKGFDEVLLVV